MDLTSRRVQATSDRKLPSRQRTVNQSGSRIPHGRPRTIGRFSRPQRKHHQHKRIRQQVTEKRHQMLCLLQRYASDVGSLVHRPD